jgi:hypothetical protein
MSNLAMVKSGLRNWLAGNNEKGASALEYVGMVIVAAIIVGAIIEVITNADVKGALEAAIKTILN